MNILWFKNADGNSQNDYHWSFFIATPDSTNGIKYDAFAVGPDQWTYSYSSNYEMTQSRRFGGYVYVGEINDSEAFKSLMLETPLPTSGENCQSWIRNVVASAISKGILPWTASGQLDTLPIRP